jgi:hypothetical protein
MNRTVRLFLGVSVGLILGHVDLAGQPASETALKVVVQGADAAAKVEDVVAFLVVVDPPAGATREVNASIVLDAMIEPCVSNPQSCVGENFTVTDPETGEISGYGCSDMMDNDADGNTDADDVDCRSVQGFSFSIATDGCFGINRATTRGTVSDLNVRPPGIRDPEGSFEKTETIDPANPANGGQQGAVCAVVFSFTRPIFLAQSSSNAICLLRGSMDTSSIQNPGDMVGPCLIRILDPSEDGLSGSGEPVKTAVTVGGDTDNPQICNGTVKVMARQAEPEPTFRRCDANDDGRHDIADAVWIVNDLLESGPPTLCPDAADCNDDGLGPDVSDAVYGIAYQFMDGSAPPAPFGSCGVDPTADSLPDCEQQGSCTP